MCTRTKSTSHQQNKILVALTNAAITFDLNYPKQVSDIINLIGYYVIHLTLLNYLAANGDQNVLKQ